MLKYQEINLFFVAYKQNWKIVDKLSSLEQWFSVLKVAQYAPVRSTPTSSLYPLAYLDLSRRTGNSHKLPVPFPVSWRFIILGCNTWLSPLSSLMYYMRLTFLFSWYWNVSLTLHPCANTVCALRNGSAAHLLCALSSINTNWLRFRVSHNNVGWTGKSKEIQKIDRNFGVGMRTGTDYEDDTALSQSNIYTQIPRQKIQSRPRLFNKLILWKSAWSCSISSLLWKFRMWTNTWWFAIPATQFTCQQGNKGRTDTSFFT